MKRGGVCWDQISRGIMRLFKNVARGDGVLMMLEGATALTVDLGSWQRLAVAHAGNSTPTMIVLCVANDSPLVCPKCLV